MAIDDLLDEHEQGERVRTWLRKNALGILGGLALGIAAIYGWRAWESHQARQMEQCRLASARRRNQRHGLPGLQRKIRALEDRERIFALAIMAFDA